MVTLMVLVGGKSVYAENIDPNEESSQYAWGENVGWLNIEPDGNGGLGVEVLDDKLTGYMWGENIGWISLSCENTSDCSRVEYGVWNDGSGNLSGYAWGENVGWINFGPSSHGVTIDPATGKLSGYAWGENIGWIKFVQAAVQAAFNVHVPSDFVHVYNWAANSVLILTIDDPDTSMEPDFQMEAEVNASGNPFNIEFADSFDVQAGHLVTVTDGSITKSHQVKNVVVHSVDVFNDTISGTANPGSTVETVDWSGAVPSLTTQADENRHWVTDYKTIDFDLLPEHSGAAVQDDEDGDRTTYSWSAQYVGEIVSYFGEVYVNGTRVEHVPWKLMPNDRIYTQMSSNAEISLDVVPPVPIRGVMSGGSSATIGVDTLEEFKGKVLMKVWEPASDREFKIKTPVAQAAVKGTELLIESEMDFTRISMLEDSADVSTLDETETLTLQELQSVTVTAEGIGEPQPVSLVDIDRFWKKLVISVGSPVDLYVSDPLGRHVGVNANGYIVNEIPGATYSGPYQVPEVVTITNPARGNYLTDLIARSTGPFHLEIAGTGLGDESFHDRYSGEVEAGQVLSYQSSYQTDDPQQVTIDIKPGGFPNPVNPKSAGVIPVGIMSTDNFDATSVDAQTVTFGIGETEATPIHYAMEDLDQDGDMDMIFHFETQDTGITCGNTSAYLRGFTLEGQKIEGYDSITTCAP
jgi:hypothetical protein